MSKPTYAYGTTLPAATPDELAKGLADHVPVSDAPPTAGDDPVGAKNDPAGVKNDLAGVNSDLAVVACTALDKVFRSGEQAVAVLNKVSLSVQSGETLAIVGASGSGKSTLLQLLGGLDAVSGGEVHWRGEAVSSMSEARRCALRNRDLGFIYQFHHLLPEFTALENVAMPLLIRRVPRELALQKAGALLADVGLAHRLTHTPGELSGGERQRVAIARALVTEPVCVLADEPTGNLDSRTADHVFSLLIDLQAQHEMALVMVTHDSRLAERAERTLLLHDGKLAAA